MNSPASIYDALYSFESHQWRKNHYPIHKRLNMNEYEDLLNWLVKNVPFKEGEGILDAGCGTGHILISLAQIMNIHGTGVSVSEKEIEHARSFIKNRPLNDILQFKLQDYSHPLVDKYDKILAIESLKHANDIDRVIANFSDALISNGMLIIADDFVVHHTADVEKHKHLWNAPQFLSLDKLKQVLKNYGFAVKTFDLTVYVPHRSAWKIYFLSKAAALYRILARNTMKINLDTFSGALLLDKLYLNKYAQYCVIIASKKEKRYETNNQRKAH